MKTLTQSVIFLIALFGVNHLASRIVPSGKSENSNHSQHLISDWYWIKGYESWVKKDKDRLIDNYGFATALDPGNLTYWRLAAQTIAYDLPVWDIEELAMTDGKQIAALRKQYGEKALQLFARSKPYFESDSTWYLSGSFLAEQACSDSEKALQLLETAIGLPDFSYAAGVNYTRLLIADNRSTDALNFLKEWYPALIESSYKSRRTEVQDWIRQLESEKTQPASSR